MDLSIIIPAFEESKKIAGDVEAAGKFLANNHLDGEIIVVDDGSTDNTSHIANSAKIPTPIPHRVVRYQQHRGKGHAVRVGVMESKGEYVMFADSGSCVPYEDALRGLRLLKNGQCDIAHGSRKMQGCRITKNQSLYRRICSRIFHWYVVHKMGVAPEFTDTQCGFKIYKGNVARHLYAKSVTNGFVFDIEIIILAQKEGYRIKEFPLNWSCDRDSRLSPTRSFWRVLLELKAIKKAVARK